MSCTACDANVGDAQALLTLSLTANGAPVAAAQVDATAVAEVIDQATGVAAVGPPGLTIAIVSPGVVVLTFDTSGVVAATTLAYFIDFTFAAELGGGTSRRCVQLRVCTPGDAGVVIDQSP